MFMWRSQVPLNQNPMPNHTNVSTKVDTIVKENVGNQIRVQTALALKERFDARLQRDARLKKGPDQLLDTIYHQLREIL